MSKVCAVSKQTRKNRSFLREETPSKTRKCNAPSTLAGPDTAECSLDSVKFITGCLLLRQALSEVVGTRVLRDARDGQWYHFNRDLDHRICEAGRLLDAAGGMEAMQIVYYETLADVCPRVPHVARSVAALWDGMGQWKLF